MQNIKITESGMSLAHTVYNNLDTIFLQIPKDIMLDSETIRVYCTSLGQYKNRNMINEVLALIEHETLHIVLEKTVNAESSDKLDMKINGLTLEVRLYREQWQNNEV